jgi:uncharacterized protein (TIRG00374 family)
MTTRRSYLVGVGILLTCLLLWWAFRDVDLEVAWRHMRSGSPGLLTAAAVAAFAGLVARGVRWRFLFARGMEPRTRDLVRAVVIGTFVNNLLPVRAGEIATLVALRRSSKVAISTGLLSSAAGRALDSAVVLAMLSASLLWSLDEASYLPLSLAVTAVSAALVALLVAASWFAEPVRSLAPAVTARLLPKRLRARADRAVDGALAGVEALRSSGRLGLAVLWTVLAWLLNGSAGWLGLRAFHVDAPAWAALTLQGILAIGVALPSSPGFFGPFEASGRAALGLYGIDPSTAVGFIVPFHLAVYFVPALLGGAAALLVPRGGQSGLADPLRLPEGPGPAGHAPR